MLLANGALVDWRDPRADGQTPLHRASSQRDAALMAFLFAHGANGNTCRTSDGFSLYHIALGHCREDERDHESALQRDRRQRNELQQQQQQHQWGQFVVPEHEDVGHDGEDEGQPWQQEPLLRDGGRLVENRGPDLENEQDPNPLQRQQGDHPLVHDHRHRHPHELAPLRDRRRDRGADQLDLLAYHSVDLNLCDRVRWKPVACLQGASCANCGLAGVFA